MSPGELAWALEGLEVHIERAEGHCGFFAVQPYEDPRGRPTSSIRLTGGGHVGRGEGVAWTIDAQRALVRQVCDALSGASGTVGELASELTGYVRAAAEGALIDLALRQHGLTLGELCGRSLASMVYLVSFDACAAPSERARSILTHNPDVRFKVDVHPHWSEGQIEALRALDRVAVLDFKGHTDPRLVRRLREAFPSAVFEDAPGSVGPVAHDAHVTGADTIAELAAGAVNVKAGRMGGFCEALRGLQRCRESGREAYFGGQFEVGVARAQARQLAALFTPDAGNDLAPIVSHESAPRQPSPLPVALCTPGFGGCASAPSQPARARGPLRSRERSPTSRLPPDGDGR